MKTLSTSCAFHAYGLCPGDVGRWVERGSQAAECGPMLIRHCSLWRQIFFSASTFRRCFRPTRGACVATARISTNLSSRLLSCNMYCRAPRSEYVEHVGFKLLPSVMRKPSVSVWPFAPASSIVLSIEPGRRSKYGRRPCNSQVDWRSWTCAWPVPGPRPRGF